MSVPSQFLMELPREELEAAELLYSETIAAAAHDTHEAHDPAPDDEGTMGDDSRFKSEDSEQIDFAPERFSGVRLTTAAAMAESTAARVVAGPRPTIAPDDFVQGMIVEHPNYGLGKISSISGAGPKRSATVSFAASAGERKFLLIHSQLSPAKGG
jgi:hypothetical protein